MRGKGCLTGDPIIFLIAFSNTNAVHICYNNKHRENFVWAAMKKEEIVFNFLQEK